MSSLNDTISGSGRSSFGDQDHHEDVDGESYLSEDRTATGSVSEVANSQEVKYKRRRQRRLNRSSTPPVEVSTMTLSQLSITRGSVTPSDEYSEELTPTSPLVSPSDLSSSLPNEQENPVVGWIRDVARRIQTPTLYVFMLVAGSRVIQSFSRLSRTAFLTQPGYAMAAASVEPVLPEGYVAPPRWLMDWRASLPWIVERPIVSLLKSRGVPVVSELLARQPAVGSRLSGAARDLAERVRLLRSTGNGEVWLSSGPMLPAVLFLPLFTVMMLKLAHAVRKKRYRDISGLGRSDSEAPSEVHRNSYREVSPPSRDQDGDEPSWMRRISPSPDGAAGAVLSSSGTAEVSPPSQVSGVEERARSQTMEPRDPSPPPGVLRTPKGRAVSPLDLSTKSSPNVVPSPLVVSSMEALEFSGVVVALVGNATLGEVNRVLAACGKYKCARTILPKSAQTFDHIVLPPSATVEYSPNVLQAAHEVGNRRGIPLIGVLACADVEGATHLPSFTHPASCIYVFLAASGVTAEEVGSVVATCVYAFESRTPTSTIPINECFSLRSHGVSGSDAATEPEQV